MFYIWDPRIIIFSVTKIPSGKRILYDTRIGTSYSGTPNGQLGATIFVHYSVVSALEGLRVCMYLTIGTQRFVRYIEMSTIEGCPLSGGFTVYNFVQNVAFFATKVKC